MSRKIGTEKEEEALLFLQNMGYKVLERNFQTKFGEVDLICIDEDCLVFVEVKYREKSDFGRAYEYVTPAKIKKIKKAAWAYIKKHACHLPDSYRLDVIAIDGDEVSYFRNVPTE